MENNWQNFIISLYVLAAAGGGGAAPEGADGAAGDEEKKRQKRGGKGVIRTKKKVEKERHIQLSRQVSLNASTHRHSNNTRVIGISLYKKGNGKYNKSFFYWNTSAF